MHCHNELSKASRTQSVLTRPRNQADQRRYTGTLPWHSRHDDKAELWTSTGHGLCFDNSSQHSSLSLCHSCVNWFGGTCAHARASTHTRTHTYTDTDTNTHTSAYTRTHAHSHARTHARTHYCMHKIFTEFLSQEGSNGHTLTIGLPFVHQVGQPVEPGL